MANGSFKPAGGIVVTAAISGLLSATIMFIGVWFTAVEGAGDDYLRDRQFIIGSLNRYDELITLAETSTTSYRTDRQFIMSTLNQNRESINVLQTDRYTSAIRLAEIRIELSEIKQTLERIEQRRGLE